MNFIKNHNRIVIAVLSGILILTGGLSAVRTAPFAYAKTDAQKKLSEKQKQIDDLEEALSSMNDSLDDYQDDVEGLSAQISNLEEQYQIKQAQIEIIEKQIEDLEADKDEQYVVMKERVKYVYENGTDGYLTVLLSSESLSDFLNRAEYVSKMREYDQGILDEFNATCVMLSEKREQINAELEELAALKSESEQKQTELADMIAVTENAIESSTAELAQKIEDAKALQK